MVNWTASVWLLTYVLAFGRYFVIHYLALIGFIDPVENALFGIAFFLQHLALN